MRWLRPISVVLLAVCYGWVLPSHQHGPAGHAHASSEPARPHGHAHHDHDHGHHHHEDDEDGGERDPDAGHGHCEVCYAARTIYRAPDVAPAVRAPDVVAAAAPAPPARPDGVRLIPAYQGRAPPAPAIAC